MVIRNLSKTRGKEALEAVKTPRQSRQRGMAETVR